MKPVFASLPGPAVLCSDSVQHGNVFVFFAAAKEEKPESKDLLADLQDISDSERKTSTAESSMGNNRTKYIYILQPALAWPVIFIYLFVALSVF